MKHQFAFITNIFGFILAVGGILLLGFAVRAYAQPNVAFPVAELGGCTSQELCRAYCDNIANISACLNFAERHGMISPEEIAQGRVLERAGGAGPGGCTSKTTCATYCQNVGNIEECVGFAERTGALSGAELAEAQAVRNAVRSGAKFPGGCTSKAACEAYCSVASHMRECLQFAEAAGLIAPEELAQAKKIMPFLISGETPGGCVRKEQCDAYCADTAHMLECLEFAEKAGLIPAKELALAKKVVPLILSGETPGGCSSEQSCMAYCKNSSHFPECIDFAVKIGMMNRLEAAAARQALKFMELRR